MQVSATIGGRLRDGLVACGMSMADLAKKAGIPYRSIQNYTADEQKPGADALIKIKQATGISIDWLLTGEGRPFYDTRAENEFVGFGMLNNIYNTYADNDLDMLTLFSDFAHNKGKLKANIIAVLNAYRERGGEDGHIKDINLDEVSFSTLYATYIRIFGHKGITRVHLPLPLKRDGDL